MNPTQYIEAVTSLTHLSTKDAAPLPRYILDDVVSLRTSPLITEALEPYRDDLNLNELSPEDQYLIKTRVIGSMATRLAMGSFYTPDLPAFTNLNNTNRLEIVHTLIDQYSQRTSEVDGPLLELNPLYDPMAPISHREARNWIYKSRSALITPLQRLDLIGSYINIIPGTFPKVPHAIESLGINDATFTQAFGRDSITDKELTQIKDERAKSNDTAMMHYLDSINFQPGPSNEALASVIHEILNGEYPNEQMVQWEVAFALWKNYPDTYKRYENYLHLLWPRRDFYPTFEVKADSIKIMDQIGAYNPAELAHGDMMIRALGIINKQGVIADPIEADIPFDPHSTQPHVRNKKAWVFREFGTRVEHFVLGRIKF